MRRFPTPGRPLRGLEVREQGRRAGAAVAIVVGGRASLLQAAMEPGAPASVARALVAGARGWAEVVRFLNVPADDPMAAAMRALGGRLEVRQFEMALEGPGA